MLYVCIFFLPNFNQKQNKKNCTVEIRNITNEKEEMSTSPASKKRKTIESKEKSTSINSNSQIVEEKSNKSSEKIQIENNKIEEKQETITGEDDSMELFEEYEEEDLTFDHSKCTLFFLLFLDLLFSNSKFTKPTTQID